MKCQCEHEKHSAAEGCQNEATKSVKTIYGTYQMCDTCAREMPEEFANEVNEPDVDDSVKYCPDCERPNQFGELCPKCLREQQDEAEVMAEYL